MKADVKGRLSEFLARIMFRLKGYGVIAANYITGRGTRAGEIDFIAVRGQVIVFVEVKQRKSLEKAAYAVSLHQRRRIWRAAETFLRKHQQYAGYDIRFDIVLVKLPFGIRHIVDAFRF